MIPIIYENDITALNQNLIAFLTDCISCTVTEERNGIFECYMTYPVNGNHFNEIQRERVLQVKPNHSMDEQFFRIYRITKPLDGIVSVYAQHISYDLSNIPVMPFSKKASITAILDTIFADSGFTYYTNYSSAKKFTVAEPKSVRACLGGEEGSVLSSWHGEFTFDNFNVKLETARGTNRGVSIEYGKNLTAIEHDTDNSEAYTHLLPYAFYNDEVITLTEKTLPISNTEFSRVKTYIVDLTEQFDDDTAINQENLKTIATTYINENLVGTAVPSITVSFEPFTSEGNLLDRVDLCDTVTVEYPVYNIKGTAKVTSTVYDVLLERYNSITLGELKSSMADTLQKQIAKAAKSNEKVYDLFAGKMDAAVESATKSITGAKGGNVVIKQDLNGKPTELLIMNTADITTATKVWRWNSGGLGYSKTGYNGTYGTAITANGEIVADYITSGSLTANVIQAGKIESLDKSSYWDIESGDIKIKGEIQATKLSLADNVTIPFSKISIDDTTGFLIKGGAITRIGDKGTITDASKAFEVTNQGLLTAANAVIYGGIYASYGTIGGWEVAGATNKTNGFWPYSLSNVLDEQLTGTDPDTGKAVGMTKKDSSGNDVPVIKERYVVFLRGKYNSLSPSSVVIGVKQMNKNSADTYTNTKYGIDSVNLPYTSSSTNWRDNSDYNFSVTASGEMTAKKGNIAGFNISSTSLTNGEFGLFPDGIKTPLYSVKIVMMAGSKFYVFKDGTLFCSSANITGNITATSLTLDGCQLDYDKDIGGAKPSTENFLIKGGAITKVGDGTLPSSSGDGLGTCFQVNASGLLKAENAVIGGTIYAGGGLIGGWTITSTDLRSTKNSQYTVGLSNQDNADANTRAFFCYDNTNSKYTFKVNRNGHVDASDIKITGGELNINDKFKVTTGGICAASGMTATSMYVKNNLFVNDNLCLNCTGTSTINSTDDNYPIVMQWINSKVCFGVSSKPLRIVASTAIEFNRSVVLDSTFGYALKIDDSNSRVFDYDSTDGIRVASNSYKTLIRGTDITLNGNVKISSGKSLSLFTGTTSSAIVLRWYNDSVCFGMDTKPLNVYAGSDISFSQSLKLASGKGLKLTYNSTTETMFNVESSSAPGEYVLNVGSNNIDITVIRGKTTRLKTSSGTVVSSDKNMKKDIEIIGDKFESIFNSLNPVTYKYKADNKELLHTGFIAQEVANAYEENGYSKNSIGIYNEFEDEGTKSCGLVYNEVIALNTYMIQKLMKRIEQLENKINSEV